MANYKSATKNLTLQTNFLGKAHSDSNIQKTTNISTVGKSNSKPVIKLSNPVSDTYCLKCKQHITTTLAIDNKNEHSVQYSKNSIARKKSSNELGISHASPYPTSSRGELKLIMLESSSHDNDQDIYFKNGITFQSSEESIVADELLYLLPKENCKDFQLESRTKKKLNLKLKDELEIDLGNSKSVTSLLSFSENQIYPIEELSEGSRSSSNKHKQLVKEIEEQKRIQEIAKIVAYSISQANKRPSTRKSYDPNKSAKSRQRTDSQAASNELIAKKNKCTFQTYTEDMKSLINENLNSYTRQESNPFSIIRYLSEKETSLETTDADLLLDKSVTTRYRSTLSTHSNAFLSTTSSIKSGCCGIKCFNFLKKLCCKPRTKNV